MKKATRTVEWQGRSGKCIAVITAEAGTHTREIKLDGQATGVYETFQVSDYRCKLTIDGKVFANDWFKSTDGMTNTPEGAAAMIHGISVDQIFVNAEVWTMIKEAQDAVSEEVTEEETETDDSIETANEIIAAVEHGAVVLPQSEIADYLKQYNDVNNEGGEGYIPTVIANESVDHARAILAAK